jgi:hypothetical protein
LFRSVVPRSDRATSIVKRQRTSWWLNLARVTAAVLSAENFN